MAQHDTDTTPHRPAATARGGPEQGRLPLEPMDPQLTDIQPGGGFVIRLEQAWGRLRRWYLKTFRGGYVERMAALRQGDFNPCPHDVLDPRDLKFHRNQGGWHWKPHDDPFTWRDRLPFARVGLAELLLTCGLAFGGAALLAALILIQNWQGPPAVAAWVAAAALAVVGLHVAWFFRNPRRESPPGPGVIVAPADGKVVTLTEIEHDEYIGGPAVEIGVFLSIYNVHINRVPLACRVIALRYKPGKCLNALRPESARENEQLAIFVEGSDAPHRRMIVRQITGAIARRIVCWLKPGDELEKGEQLGMIKFGSRTDLVLPREPGLQIKTNIGDSIKAGTTVLAEYGRGQETGGRRQ
jgi:phosphatidylserine decarboxylase